MDNSDDTLIGFLPRFHGLGESYPLIKIAEKYEEIGGKPLIFSHGGEYEYLAEVKGFKIIRIEPVVKNTSKYFKEKSERELIKVIEKEAKIYRKYKINALLHSGVFFDAILATKLAKITSISLVTGTWVPSYFKNRMATFPDNFENKYTKIIPKIIKDSIFNWYATRYKGNMTKKFNSILKKMELDFRFNSKNDLMLGDYTLVADDIEFLGVKNTYNIPKENYIGPILPDYNQENEKDFDYDIKKHLKRPGPSIILTMGTSIQWKKFFLKLIKILNTTTYNVIATYTTILNENELPDTNKNILMKKYIPNITELTRNMDLAIIHGGRGTVYSTIYSETPCIGFALHTEQQSNLDNIVRHNAGIRLSKKFFDKKDFLKTIEKIFDKYENFSANTKKLKQLLPKDSGEERAAKRIMELIK